MSVPVMTLPVPDPLNSYPIRTRTHGYGSGRVNPRGWGYPQTPNTYTYTHTNTHICIYTYIYTYTHTYIHTHIQPCSIRKSNFRMTSDYVHAHQSSEFNTILRIQCLYIRLAKYNKTVMFCIRLNMHFNGQ